MAEPALERFAAGPGPDELRLPCDNGEPLAENTQQLVAIVDGFNGLSLRYQGRRDVFVAADLLIHRDPDYGRGNRCNPPIAPDIFVAFGVLNRHRRSFVLWEEPKGPDFVLEVMSQSTWRRDRDEKGAIYASMGVREYFLFDPHEHLSPRVQGFVLNGGKYQRLPAAPLAKAGVGVYSPLLGLHLCADAQPAPEHLERGLRWYDAKADGFLQTHVEASQRAAEANQRADELERRVRESESRARAAEAELAALRAKIASANAGADEV